MLSLAVSVLESHDIPYVLVGALASSSWGEVRFTNDIDIVVVLDVFDVAILCQAFGGEEFYVSQTAAEEAVRFGGQFNVIHSPTSNKIDFMIAKEGDWPTLQLQRRVRRKVLESVDCYVAAPEDVILGKLIYYKDGGSEKHLRDIASMLRVSNELIDRSYLDQHAATFGLTEIWQMVQAAADKRD